MWIQVQSFTQKQPFKIHTFIQLHEILVFAVLQIIPFLVPSISFNEGYSVIHMKIKWQILFRKLILETVIN